MWWFAALHANLLAFCRRVVLPSGAPSCLLDAGCGTGGLLSRIARRYPDSLVVGLDPDGHACARAHAKSARPVCGGSVNALPFADGTFAAVFSADVLCHRDVDERQALAQIHRVLRAGGVLVLNLPAYPWLLSRHDVAVYNVRRYTRRSAAALLREAGFRLVYASYWNMLLFPMMVIARKWAPRRTGAASDVRLYPPAVEAVCRWATGFERVLLRLGVRLPFGGSLLAVAAKEERAYA